MKKATKLTAMLLSIVMAISIIPTAFASDMISFSDVSESAWYHDDVMAMAEAGYISGYTDGSFKPEENVTYAEFATMIAKAFYGTTLNDVINKDTDLVTDYMEKMTIDPYDDWWTPYMWTLKTERLFSGYGTSVPYSSEICMTTAAAADGQYDDDWAIVQDMMDTTMTRQAVFASMAAILLTDEETKSALAADGIVLTYGEDQKPRTDKSDEYAAQYTDWDIDSAYGNGVLLELGLVQGSSDTLLNLEGNVTRAELATLLARFLNNEYLTADPYVAYEDDTVEETTTEAVSGSYDMSKYTVPADFNLDGILTEEEVGQMLDQLQEEFPDGSYLGKAIFGADAEREDYTGSHIYYTSSVLGSGGDCIAWAYYVSDRIFGDLPVVKYTPGEWVETDVRIGDVVATTYHYMVSTMDTTWIERHGVYGYNTTDSGSSFEITWGDVDTGFSSLTYTLDLATIMTRYPQ